MTGREIAQCVVALVVVAGVVFGLALAGVPLLAAP